MNDEVHKTLEEIRKDIEDRADDLRHPYSSAIVSFALQAARKYYGEDVKNSLIDEFGLEEHGWRKDSKEIKRFKVFGEV